LGTNAFSEQRNDLSIESGWRVRNPGSGAD
jgi:hypothetical protein